MKINKFIKKKDGLYNVELEDSTRILIHEDLILKYDLLLKREIDSNDMELILKENINYTAYNKAIKYISVRLRSAYEIRNYLKKYVEDQNIIDIVVDKLQSQGYLNDEEFARAYVNDKIMLSNDGPYKIMNALKEFKIDDEIVYKSIQIYTEDLEKERIKKLIEKKKSTNTNSGTFLLKQKILAFLVNLGYNKHTVLEELSNFSSDDEEIYKKEYEKAYNKLSKKYSGYELEQRIKQKMYQRGFNRGGL